MTGTLAHPHPPGTLAMVIGSGSVLCAASVGMLHAFQQAGIGISMTVGSSGGSLYAALIALGAAPEVLHEMSLSLWSSDLFEGYAANLRQALSGEVRFTEKSSLIDDSAINQRLSEVYGDLTFNDTRLPLHVVATELYTGESVTLSEGRIYDAVRASIAIPLVLAPWQIGEAWYVDGAVANPLPVDVAIREGARVIVALGFELPLRSRMRSYTAVTSHFNSLYMNNILKAKYAFFNAVHHAEIIPILPDFDRPIGTFDVTQIPYIIEQGQKATAAQLPYLLRLLESNPD